MANNEKINKKIITYGIIGYFVFMVFHNLSEILKKYKDLNIKPLNQILSDAFNPMFWFALLTGNLEMYDPKKDGNGNLGVGNIELLDTEASTNYAKTAKYFKVTEYMGASAVPKLYSGNLDLLFFNLDKIREKWGSAIAINYGFDSRPVENELNATCYQRCLCVAIFPKVGNTILLNQMILNMRENKQISNCTIVHEPNKYIYISFTKTN